MTRKSTKLSLMVITITFFFLLGMVSSAKALTIDASNLPYSPWVINSTYWTGTETSQAQINEVIASIIGPATELYKQNVGGAEEGPLASAYETTFFDTPLDPSDATITWEGPSYISPPSYLLVKDGIASPAWYLFNLSINYPTSLPWNGQETIELLNFWPGQGAISHVALYGKVAVPEPTTLFLLGSGLVALGLVRRKFKA